MTLRDVYKKSHRQVAGPAFYQVHLLYDKHYDEQVELVDSIAERIQLLGGVSLAMAPDVARPPKIKRPPRGREEVPVQLSRLVDAHQTHYSSNQETRASLSRSRRRWYERPACQRSVTHQ